MQHDIHDPYCAFHDQALGRPGIMTRLVLGIRCRICSNIGAIAGGTYYGAEYFDDGQARDLHPNAIGREILEQATGRPPLRLEDI